MEFANVINNWKTELDKLGVQVECTTFDCIEEIIEKDEMNMYEFIEEARNEMLLTISPKKIRDFLEYELTNKELVECFLLDIELDVYITETGDLLVQTNDFKQYLDKNTLELTLKELIGEEKFKSIIIVSYFQSCEGKIKKFQNIEEKISQILFDELEKRIVQYFKLLGKQVENKLKELEEKLYQIYYGG
jgi:hypothetical protein